MTKPKKIFRDQPVTYQIQVQGCISQRWANWFDDMTITVKDQDDIGQPGGGSAITTLTGIVADQAALLGLLQKLYTLGFPLLLVRRKEANCTNGTTYLGNTGQWQKGFPLCENGGIGNV
jgi:hypothetical protein